VLEIYTVHDAIEVPIGGAKLHLDVDVAPVLNTRRQQVGPDRLEDEPEARRRFRPSFQTFRK
jgi:hypothetical protein